MIQLRLMKPILFKKHRRLTDVEAIEGLQAADESIERRFYLDCRSYFFKNQKNLFGFTSSTRQPIDLFHDSFLIMWAEIQSRHIFVRNGIIYRYRRNGTEAPMSASLLTYLMSIARYKNLELLREDEIFEPKAAISDFPDSDNDNQEMTIEGLALMEINAMPRRCREILTMFYVEGKSLDEILSLRPENTTKDGLKSGKSKCMAQLRTRISEKLDKLKIKH